MFQAFIVKGQVVNSVVVCVKGTPRMKIFIFWVEHQWFEIGSIYLVAIANAHAVARRCRLAVLAGIALSALLVDRAQLA